MTPSLLATFSNQNALTEYMGLCFNLGRVDQAIMVTEYRTGKETKELEDPDCVLKGLMA